MPDSGSDWCEPQDEKFWRERLYKPEAEIAGRPLLPVNLRNSAIFFFRDPCEARLQIDTGGFSF